MLPVDFRTEAQNSPGGQCRVEISPESVISDNGASFSARWAVGAAGILYFRSVFVLRSLSAGALSRVYMLTKT